MTSRERVLAALHHEQTDRAPRDLSWGLCPAKLDEFRERTGLEDYEDYFALDTRIVDFGPSRLDRGGEGHFAGADQTPGFKVDEWGVGLGKSQDRSLHFEHLVSPLKESFDEAAALAFPLPDFTAPYRHKDLPDRVAALHRKGLAVCGNIAQTVFEKTWAIRGMEETLMDMATGEAAIGMLMDRIMKLRIAQARILLAAGIDVIMLGDDVGMQSGMMMSLEMWRSYLKPRLRCLIEEIRSIDKDIPVFYHSCGDVTEVIPELIEVGVTVLNPLQPECVDHMAVAEAYGDKLAFWGGVSAQRNLSFGSPKDVREEVRLCLEVLGQDNGYLIGPNHMIEPEVPWENILAFIDAVDSYGKR
jgi:uroporphyrinogen decarboxylase